MNRMLSAAPYRSLQGHMGAKKTRKKTHSTPTCAPAVLTADIMYFCHSFDITERERERDEREQRQQMHLTGNERVGEVRSHHPRLSQVSYFEGYKICIFFP